MAKNLPTPAAAWIISPMTRAEPLVFERHDAATADGLCDGGTIKDMWDCIRRAGKPDELPYADPSYSPYHASAAGLPPMFFSWDGDEVRVLPPGLSPLASLARQLGVWCRHLRSPLVMGRSWRACG